MKESCNRARSTNPQKTSSKQEKSSESAEKAVKLKQEKALKFHVITDMEGYWDQTNGHTQAPHPVKFERWEEKKSEN